MQTFDAENSQRLRDALIRLPQVERWIPYDKGFWVVNELAENEKFSKAVWQDGRNTTDRIRSHYPIWNTSDTSLLDFFKIKVSWKPKANKKKCILVNEELYEHMRRHRVAPNEILTIGGDSYKIAGTFQSIPYLSNQKINVYSFILIDPNSVPTPIATFLWQSQENIRRCRRLWIEPFSNWSQQWWRRCQPICVIIWRFHMFMIEMLQSIAWILAAVSLVICLISIFSTVMLDTQTRKGSGNPQGERCLDKGYRQALRTDLSGDLSHRRGVCGGSHVAVSCRF